MKRIAFIVLLLLSIGNIYAQKFAYIDTEYILQNIPDYKEAQKQLDGFSSQWQKEIEAKQKKIEKMYQDYQAEEILLTEQMKNKRREDILEKEQEVIEFKKEKFGIDGELFKKRKELVKPIQEKIYKAVQETANVSKYAIIFDKASGLSMVYSNPKYDKSDDVLRRMGFKPGSEK
ncbi:MAG: OmpH family outer membrane protein [Bacteroidetes bacterium]|nr:MAG: OmpH family outer membrane protein [Bacteroidota bacterium]MBL1143535.1 OmpH family outer membrane protein [Bacteroidota bacterium]MCB0801965.1 OmpH family outer membrane protein [Flavobacteriales bacterium]NOG56337.1 OmpH family outer membrane protein [Bacteroidota bacterium]